MEDFSVPLNTISFHHPQNLLDQRSENFFHEGKDSEYFQIWGPGHLCHNYTILL